MIQPVMTPARRPAISAMYGVIGRATMDPTDMMALRRPRVDGPGLLKAVLCQTSWASSRREETYSLSTEARPGDHSLRNRWQKGFNYFIESSKAGLLIRCPEDVPRNFRSTDNTQKKRNIERTHGSIVTVGRRRQNSKHESDVQPSHVWVFVPCYARELNPSNLEGRLACRIERHLDHL
jgi:hypothetical protein